MAMYFCRSWMEWRQFINYLIPVAFIRFFLFLTSGFTGNCQLTIDNWQLTKHVDSINMNLIVLNCQNQKQIFLHFRLLCGQFFLCDLDGTWLSFNDCDNPVFAKDLVLNYTVRLERRWCGWFSAQTERFKCDFIELLITLYFNVCLIVLNNIPPSTENKVSKSMVLLESNYLEDFLFWQAS